MQCASATLRIAAWKDLPRPGLTLPLAAALIQPFHRPSRPAYLHFPVIFGANNPARGPGHSGGGAGGRRFPLIGTLG